MGIIHRAYKVEIDPNNQQRTALLRHAGCARWAFNWGLNQKIEAYKTTGKSPNVFELSRKLNALKRAEDGGISWMYDVSKCAPQESLRDLDRAYQHFFRRCRGKNGKKGFPRFKSKKNGVGSFRLHGIIKVNKEGTHIVLPRLGALRLKERGYLPGPDCSDVKILSATVSEKAGRWFVSIQVEQEIQVSKTKVSEIIGVDVGIKNLAVLSDGTVYENPRSLHSGLKRLRLLQKSVSRKVKGSNNRKRAMRKVSKQHYRIGCIRKDAIHKVTTDIVRRCGNGMICIEDLNVKGMVQNRKLARTVSDAALAEVHRQLRYKAEWNGIKLVEADRWYPSSKKCSSCGTVKDSLDLSERTYRCGQCGLVLDRDLNAALNLRALSTESSSGIEACGDGVRPLGSLLNLMALSVKQEPNSKVT